VSRIHQITRQVTAQSIKIERERTNNGLIYQRELHQKFYSFQKFEVYHVLKYTEKSIDTENC